MQKLTKVNQKVDKQTDVLLCNPAKNVWIVYTTNPAFITIVLCIVLKHHVPGLTL